MKTIGGIKFFRVERTDQGVIKTALGEIEGPVELEIRPVRAQTRNALSASASVTVYGTLFGKPQPARKPGVTR